VACVHAGSRGLVEADPSMRASSRNAGRSRTGSSRLTRPVGVVLLRATRCGSKTVATSAATSRPPAWSP
jgi:hypothetical protein